MLTLRLSLAFLLLSATSSNSMGIWVRNANGEWVRPSWEKRANPGDVLRLPLTNKDNRSYSTPVLMGTPAQPIQMSVSLSQNHILVATAANEGEAGFYNPSASSSYTAGQQSVAVTGPGGQSLEATFSQEVCDVADFSYHASVALTSPASSPSLYATGVYGVLGYGLDAKPDVPANSTLLGIYLPGGLKNTEAVCGIELNYEEPGIPGGTFTMGGRDNTAFAGGFTVVPVVGTETLPGRPSGTIPVDSINAYIAGASSSGDQSYQAGVVQNGYGSIDPYYPFISIPTAAARELYSQIQGAQEAPSSTSGALRTGNTRFTLPCRSAITLRLTLGGRTFTMETRDGITKEGNRCYGTIEGNDDGFYRIGSPFMRNVYTTFGAVFDAEGNATPNVAFAKKVWRTPSTEPTPV
ncbi:acid protease [Serendipita vermifera]|nr:acid protease [Serendipita vermifera]